MAKAKFLTQEGYDRLVAELKDLQEVKLPAVLERLKDAVAQGDISENAEYETSMAEKDLAEARISEIESMLKNVEIIKKGTKATGDIKYGSKVKIKDEKGETYTLTIVGTGEVDSAHDTVSFESPLGKAIRGKKKGDKVFVRAPKGRYKVDIVSVK